MKQDLIIIIDCGSVENARLARAIRHLGVYSEIANYDTTLEEIQGRGNLKGIIIDKGPLTDREGNRVEAREDVMASSIPHIVFDSLPSDDHALEERLKPFLFGTCKAERNWNMRNFIDDQVALVRKQVGDGKVLLALSGGVDSSVVAALLVKAIGKNLVCVHVNHGLLRKGESEAVIKVFRHEMNANLVYVDASERFLGKLQGVADPELKRKIIGKEFIEVFAEEAKKLDGIGFLGQGTIYPDILESGTKLQKMVKSHHNVGGLPKDLQFALVEPLKYLFKDEVRACGLELGLPPSMVYRQPFPGPGLGVRCLGAITKERLDALRESDAILREEFEKNGLSRKVWQYFTVIPDFKSTGVKHNERCFEYPVIIRAVNTVDAMTATIEEIPYPILKEITGRILNEIPGVNRVLYDLSPKPCATIEWE